MRWLFLFLGVAAAAGIARADDDTTPPPTPLGYGQPDPVSAAVAPITVVQGEGVKVGESTTVFPVLGIETGFVSNVFYDDVSPIGAGLLRVLGEVGFGTLSPARLDVNEPQEAPDGIGPDPTATPPRGEFQGRADVYAAWDQYLSGNSKVLDQGGLSGGVVLHGIANAGHPLTFDVLNHFERVIRATNFESNHDTNQDLNHLMVRLGYTPTGRTVGGYLYYAHLLDLFEQDNQQFADRFDHTFGAHVQWQTFPLTRLFADVSIGVFGGVGSSSTKVSSNPFNAIVGIQTLLSLNLTLQGEIGFTEGNYASGPDYATAVGNVQLGYRYSPLGRVQLWYAYQHQDSINANFFRDHVLGGLLDHEFQPFALFVMPELRFREYNGLLPQIMPSSPVRDDTIFALAVGARYNFRNWLAATLQYRLVSDQTNFTYTFMGLLDNPSYTRHEIMLGLRGAL